MGVFDRLFGKNKQNKNQKVSCPRCLGKGHVDEADIKRLKKELAWMPGACAYCDKSGKVDANLANKVSADESYLTTDLSKEERAKLLENDAEAKKRAEEYDKHLKGFTSQILVLFGEHKLGVSQIAEFYLSNNTKLVPGTAEYEKQKNELIAYIKKVIIKNLPQN